MSRSAKNEASPQRGLANNIQALNDWHQMHCDDEWEHRYGIKLETRDNPGWLLTVDLIHTNLQGATMDPLCEGCAPDSHPVSPREICCNVQDN